MSKTLWMIEDVIRGEKISIHWFERANIQFAHPFYIDTVSSLPDTTSRRISDAQELLEILKEENIPDPSGFIFHMTRCGSTLLTQMLKEDPANLVISEPAPIEILLNTQTLSQTIRLFYFSGAIKSFGKCMVSPEKRYFLKFSYNAKWIKSLKEIFPNTPIIFVYRDLKEIVASNLKNPPHWLMDYTSKDNYEQVLIDLFKVQIDQISIDHESIDLFIDYKDISPTLPIQVLNCFGLDNSDQKLIERMKNSMNLYSKKSQLPWNEQKSKSLDLNLNLKHKKVLDELYQKLQSASIKE
ncbi:MAG: sulfotransferase [Bacteriovoracaceae bacterium]|nr:sulfotransferase [Bacteriovoracaceae bacterium]